MTAVHLLVLALWAAFQRWTLGRRVAPLAPPWPPQPGLPIDLLVLRARRGDPRGIHDR